MAQTTEKGSVLSTTIKLVEHVVLFKFKDGYTEEQELDMYKGLWSFLDYFPTIMAMSLGRVLTYNAEGVTHVLVMRFGTKAALDEYMADGYRLEISFKYIVPFFNGELTADFEAEVTSDLTEIYRESEKYSNGVEHVELFKIKEGTSEAETEKFLNSVAALSKRVQVNMYQLTAGTNFKPHQKYTHAFVVRLPSVEDLGVLIEDLTYLDFLESSYPILDDHLRVDFLVNESINGISENFLRQVTSALSSSRSNSLQKWMALE